MELQMPVKLPRLSMRHQTLLDAIDRELPRGLARQGPFIRPPQEKQPQPQPTANAFGLPVTHQPRHQSITGCLFVHRVYVEHLEAARWLCTLRAESGNGMVVSSA